MVNNKDTGELIEDYKDYVGECFSVYYQLSIEPIDTPEDKLVLKSNTPSCENDSRHLTFNQDTVPSEGFKTGGSEFYASRKLFNTDTTNYEPTYFHHETIKIPPRVGYEAVVTGKVGSRFSWGQVSVVFEVVNPHQRGGKKAGSSGRPLCQFYCFSGYSKYNEMYFEQVIPGDTILVVWFVDVSPNVRMSGEYRQPDCLRYDFEVEIAWKQPSDIRAEIQGQQSQLPVKFTQFCYAGDLPNSISTISAEHLADGVHFLDLFRIDTIMESESVHDMKLKVKDDSLLTVNIPYIEVGEVELELWDSELNTVLTTSMLIEKDEQMKILVPGDEYVLRFKFLFNERAVSPCESMILEFALRPFQTGNSTN